MKSKLLEDEVFLEKIKKYIENMLSNETSNFMGLWEQFKCELQIAALERASVLRQKEKQQEKQLLCTLEYMLDAESSKPGLFMKEIKEVKAKLEAIDTERYRGAMIRARCERL